MEGQMEILGFLGIGFGALLFLIGWIWLIVLGFKEGGPLWGILIIFFSWLAGIIFCFMKKTGWIPLALMLVGIFFYAIGVIPIAIKMMDTSGGSPF
jgi:hypothetical protein